MPDRPRWSFSLPHSCRIVGKLVAAVQRSAPHTECLLGTYATLWLPNFYKDVYPQIGLVEWIGPAAKNANLIVRCAKYQFEKGTRIHVTKHFTRLLLPRSYINR